MTKKVIILSAVWALGFLYNAYGGWSGPVTIIDGEKGSGQNQFGIFVGESVNSGPESFALDKNENIYIADSINRRLKKYNANYQLIKTIYPPNNVVNWPRFGWPGYFTVNLNGYFIATYTAINKDSIDCILNSDGILIKCLDDPGIPYIGTEGFYYRKGITNIFNLYSFSGDIIRTYTSWPSEIPTWSGIQRPGYVEIRLSLNNKQYLLKDTVNAGYIFIDKDKFIYAISRGHVTKFDQRCNKVATLNITWDKMWAMSNPIVSWNGNVYNSLMTNSAYKIQKWTWSSW